MVGELLASRIVAGLACAATLASAAPPVDGPAADADLVRTSLYVPVRDGTRLAVNIYRPARGGRAVADRLPVIFAFTPYRARFREKDGKLVDIVDSPVFGFRGLIRSGYVVAVADVRGKGASFGARRGFLDQTEAHDGADLIAWLAARPWADGKVGMVGCSYLGGSAMLVAGAQPPALRAVFVGATDLDKYDFVRNGGITAQFNTRPDEPPEVDLASVPVDADTGGSQLKAAVAEHGRNTPMAALWEGMPYRDSVSPLTGNRFWEEVGPYTHLAALRNPRLAWYLWDNWEDEPNFQMILNAANIPQAKLIVGPGSHCVPPTVFSITDEEHRFFDHYLKGIDNGIDREPRYAWYAEAPGGGTMVRSNALPGVGIARTSLYLAAGGGDDRAVSLSPPPPASARFATDYDVGSGEYFAFWPAALDGKGLTYTSRPLAADAAMAGYPVAHLQARLDRPDANLFVYLEDVDPAGKVHMVSFGRLAAAHRALAKAPYDTLDLPWHPGRSTEQEPMTAGKPASLAIAMMPRAYTFAAGHRLRVTLTGADPRQRNLAAIRQSPPPVFTIASGGPSASRIDIPFTNKPTLR